MKTIAAYLLLSLGGKPATEASIAELLSSVGVEADADASARLVAAVADKVYIHEMLHFLVNSTRRALMKFLLRAL
jgi:ribosomal protein L12E/L44/L45/RPP1/RPP2